MILLICGFGIVSNDIDVSMKTIDWDKTTFPRSETEDNLSTIIGFLDNNVTKNIIIGIQNLNDIADRTTDSTNYLDLRKDIGSLYYEYPACSTRTGEYISSSNKYILTSTYTFKNLLDFVLFYYHYKHVVNHYLCKLNLLLNTKIFNNELTYKNLYDVLANKLNYVNANTYSNLVSLSNVFNSCECLFKAFPNNNNFDDVSITKFCSPFGNMDWIYSSNHSELSEYTSTMIDESKFPTDDKKTFDESMKKLLSIYRPFYIEYKNMFTAATSKNIDSPYSVSTGFNWGYSKGTDYLIDSVKNSDGIVTNSIIKNYCRLNSAALNKDYGWGKNEYTIDSILNPEEEISINGL